MPSFDQALTESGFLAIAALIFLLGFAGCSMCMGPRKGKGEDPEARRPRESDTNNPNNPTNPNKSDTSKAGDSPSADGAKNDTPETPTKPDEKKSGDGNDDDDDDDDGDAATKKAQGDEYNVDLGNGRSASFSVPPGSGDWTVDIYGANNDHPPSPGGDGGRIGIGGSTPSGGGGVVGGGGVNGGGVVGGGGGGGGGGVPAHAAGSAAQGGGGPNGSTNNAGGGLARDVFVGAGFVPPPPFDPSSGKQAAGQSQDAEDQPTTAEILASLPGKSNFAPGASASAVSTYCAFPDIPSAGPVRVGKTGFNMPELPPFPAGEDTKGQGTHVRVKVGGVEVERKPTGIPPPIDVDVVSGNGEVVESPTAMSQPTSPINQPDEVVKARFPGQSRAASSGKAETRVEDPLATGKQPDSNDTRVSVEVEGSLGGVDVDVSASTGTDVDVTVHPQPSSDSKARDKVDGKAAEKDSLVEEVSSPVGDTVTPEKKAQAEKSEKGETSVKVEINRERTPEYPLGGQEKKKKEDTKGKEKVKEEKEEVREKVKGKGEEAVKPLASDRANSQGKQAVRIVDRNGQVVEIDPEVGAELLRRIAERQAKKGRTSVRVLGPDGNEVSLEKGSDGTYRLRDQVGAGQSRPCVKIVGPDGERIKIGSDGVIRWPDSSVDELAEVTERLAQEEKAGKEPVSPDRKEYKPVPDVATLEKMVEELEQQQLEEETKRVKTNDLGETANDDDGEDEDKVVEDQVKALLEEVERFKKNGKTVRLHEIEERLSILQQAAADKAEARRDEHRRRALDEREEGYDEINDQLRRAAEERERKREERQRRREERAAEQRDFEEQLRGVRKEREQRHAAEGQKRETEAYPEHDHSYANEEYEERYAEPGPSHVPPRRRSLGYTFSPSAVREQRSEFLDRMKGRYQRLTEEPSVSQQATRSVNGRSNVSRRDPRSVEPQEVVEDGPEVQTSQLAAPSRTSRSRVSRAGYGHDRPVETEFAESKETLDSRLTSPVHSQRLDGRDNKTTVSSTSAAEAAPIESPVSATRYQDSYHPRDSNSQPVSPIQSQSSRTQSSVTRRERPTTKAKSAVASSATEPISPVNSSASKGRRPNPGAQEEVDFDESASQRISPVQNQTSHAQSSVKYQDQQTAKAASAAAEQTSLVKSSASAGRRRDSDWIDEKGPVLPTESASQPNSPVTPTQALNKYQPPTSIPLGPTETRYPSKSEVTTSSKRPARPLALDSKPTAIDSEPEWVPTPSELDYPLIAPASVSSPSLASHVMAPFRQPKALGYTAQPGPDEEVSGVGSQQMVHGRPQGVNKETETTMSQELVTVPKQKKPVAESSSGGSRVGSDAATRRRRDSGYASNEEMSTVAPSRMEPQRQARRSQVDDGPIPERSDSGYASQAESSSGRPAPSDVPPTKPADLDLKEVYRSRVERRQREEKRSEPGADVNDGAKGSDNKPLRMNHKGHRSEREEEEATYEPDVIDSKAANPVTDSGTSRAQKQPKKRPPNDNRIHDLDSIAETTKTTKDRTYLYQTPPGHVPDGINRFQGAGHTYQKASKEYPDENPSSTKGVAPERRQKMNDPQSPGNVLYGIGPSGRTWASTKPIDEDSNTMERLATERRQKVNGPKSPADAPESPADVLYGTGPNGRTWRSTKPTDQTRHPLGHAPAETNRLDDTGLRKTKEEVKEQEVTADDHGTNSGGRAAIGGGGSTRTQTIAPKNKDVKDQPEPKKDAIKAGKKKRVTKISNPDAGGAEKSLRMNHQGRLSRQDVRGGQMSKQPMAAINPKSQEDTVKRSEMPLDPKRRDQSRPTKEADEADFSELDSRLAEILGPYGNFADEGEGGRLRTNHRGNQRSTAPGEKSPGHDGRGGHKQKQTMPAFDPRRQDVTVMHVAVAPGPELEDVLRPSQGAGGRGPRTERERVQEGIQRRLNESEAARRQAASTIDSKETKDELAKGEKEHRSAMATEKGHKATGGTERQRGVGFTDGAARDDRDDDSRTGHRRHDNETSAARRGVERRDRTPAPTSQKNRQGVRDDYGEIDDDFDRKPGTLTMNHQKPKVPKGTPLTRELDHGSETSSKPPSYHTDQGDHTYPPASSSRNQSASRGRLAVSNKSSSSSSWSKGGLGLSPMRALRAVPQYIGNAKLFSLFFFLHIIATAMVSRQFAVLVMLSGNEAGGAASSGGASGGMAKRAELPVDMSATQDWVVQTFGGVINPGLAFFLLCAWLGLSTLLLGYLYHCILSATDDPPRKDQGEKEKSWHKSKRFTGIVWRGLKRGCMAALRLIAMDRHPSLLNLKKRWGGWTYLRILLFLLQATFSTVVLRYTIALLSLVNGATTPTPSGIDIRLFAKRLENAAKAMSKWPNAVFGLLLFVIALYIIILTWSWHSLLHPRKRDLRKNGPRQSKHSLLRLLTCRAFGNGIKVSEDRYKYLQLAILVVVVVSFGACLAWHASKNGFVRQPGNTDGVITAFTIFGVFILPMGWVMIKLDDFFLTPAVRHYKSRDRSGTTPVNRTTAARGRQ